MANFQARGEAYRNGHNGHGPAPTAATVEAPRTEESLGHEVQRLTAENQQLLGLMAGAAGEGTDLARLRTENGQLRATITELEQLLSSEHPSQDWAEQQREFEALLEEKSEVIRSLHQKLQEARAETEAPQKCSSGTAKANGGPVTDRQLETLKAELEEQREQLAADEESLMTQMRQMEMNMSRERAELARQRSELQRLHNDLKHEMEQASRDGPLRERLNNLNRRQPGAAEPPKAPSDPTPPPKNSGVLRRLFRPGQ